jgi:hypothetical protein
VETETKNFEFKGGLKKVSLSLIFLGAAALLTSFGINKTVGWVDYTVFNIYFVTIAISAIFFLALTGVIQASWLTPYKRIPEAMTQFLPVSFVMMGVGVFGLHTIYEWTHKDVVANDPILIQKVAWLNEPRFVITSIVIFALWIGITKAMRSYSERMDSVSEGAAYAKKYVGFSAISLIIFSLTICVFSFDWLMSVEPHWFSTIFGVYVFGGSFVSGMSFVAIAVIMLRKWGYFGKAVTDDHVHDIAKWIFGMSIFWAYIWISQYILIWYANIPEETEYFVLRHHHWNGLFWMNLILNFFVPFFGLMTRKAKRTSSRVMIVALILLLGHLIDIYVMLAPKVFEHHGINGVSGGGILQVLQIIGGFGLFIYVVGTALSKRKLVVNNDPTFAEGSHLHQ